MRLKELELRWTVLDLWKRGDRDNAILALKGYETVATDAMEKGREAHDSIAKNKIDFSLINDNCIFEDDVNETNIRVEVFNRKDYPYTLTMTGSIDVLNIKDGYLIDWKTGSEDYTSKQYNQMQLYVYDYLTHLRGDNLKFGVLAKVVKRDKYMVRDFSVYNFTEQTRKEAHNFIETISNEIYDFLNS